MKYFTIALLLTIISCNGFVKTGVPQSSATIKVSKMKGAFICQYVPDSQIIEIGSDKYRIDEAWIEYRWNHTDNKLNVEIEKDFRNFYIRAINLQTNEYDFKFSPEDDFFEKIEVINPDHPENKSLGYKGGKLDMRLKKNQPIPDKIEIKFEGSQETKTITFTKLIP